MSIQVNNRDLLVHIHELYCSGESYWYEMCNEIWCYGEVDFWVDYLRYLLRAFSSEHYVHMSYTRVGEIYSNNYYNANTWNPSDRKQKKDSYLDFILGVQKEVKSLKTFLNEK